MAHGEVQRTNGRGAWYVWPTSSGVPRLVCSGNDRNVPSFAGIVLRLVHVDEQYCNVFPPC